MDQQDNAEFVNVGMEQPAEVEHHDDVIIKVDGPSNGKGWMIAAICAFVAVVGLGAAFVFMMMSSNDATKKVDDVQAQLDARTEELNKFREATGVEDAADFVAGGNIDFDLTAIYNAVPNTEGQTIRFSLEGAYVKDNNDYQVASFGVVKFDASEKLLGSGTGYFYRVLPDGDWKYSGFSGNGQAACADLTDEDKAAFEGVLECAE